MAQGETEGVPEGSEGVLPGVGSGVNLQAHAVSDFRRQHHLSVLVPSIRPPNDIRMSRMRDPIGVQYERWVWHHRDTSNAAGPNMPRRTMLNELVPKRPYCGAR